MTNSEEHVTTSLRLGAMRSDTSEQDAHLDAVHVDDLLGELVDRSGSDLHICVGAPPIMRVDGQLIPLKYQEITPGDAQRLIYQILTDEQIRRFEADFELDFSYAIGKTARFRANVYRDKGTVAAAFRLILAKVPTIRELGLPLILEELTRRPRGLILVTGPTGCGKSTTLAAMIHQINTERKAHIITIEDPIEYLHEHRVSLINQRELGQDTKSFANALRSALREDPDVILVGEMRDLETISVAITCAETGHLVLATLHTINSAQTVDRIVDVFPPGQQEQIRFQLSNNLEAVLCQQLLPRARMTGRVAAMEIMLATPAIRNMIRESKTHQMQSAIQTSAGVGMQTMDQHLRELYQRRLITYDDAMARAMNPDELKRLLTTTPTSGKLSQVAPGPRRP